MRHGPSKSLLQDRGGQKPTPIRPKKGGSRVPNLPLVDDDPVNRLFQRVRSFLGESHPEERMDDRGSLCHLTVGGTLR